MTELKRAKDSFTNNTEPKRTRSASQEPIKSLKSDFTHEEHVIIANNFEDVVHQFTDESAFTMYKSTPFPAWRPDKVVMQTARLSNGSENQQ